jgi:hypothetical protein
MTLNKDGNTRKIRENKPNNYRWDRNSLILAFYIFRSGISTLVKGRVSEKMGIGPDALNARINEYQILETRGKTDKVATKTERVYFEFKNKSSEECVNKIGVFLGDEYLGSDDTLDENNFIEEVTINENKAKPTVESIFQNSDLIGLVPTIGIIDKIISDGFLTYSGKYINEKNLVHLKSEIDLNFIDTAMMGCYFIFSNIPKENVPLFSKDGYLCYDKTIIKDGIEYRCLYNGKSEKVKERLKVHLFNSHTLEKINSGLAKTISGTGAMSLVSLSQNDLNVLEKSKHYMPSKHKLKPVEKSLQPDSLDKREGHAYFLNGIDITEKDWQIYNFAVLVLKSDSEFGKILIEEAFCKLNGRPPLCRRHG